MESLRCGGDRLHDGVDLYWLKERTFGDLKEEKTTNL